MTLAELAKLKKLSIELHDLRVEEYKIAQKIKTLQAEITTHMAIFYPATILSSTNPTESHLVTLSNN